MSSVSAISAVGTSSSSAAYLPTLLSLQSDLLLYSRYATGNSIAAVDFKQLELALEMRNTADAQTALARLRRASETTDTNPFVIYNTNETTPDIGVAGENAGTTSPPAGSLVNVMA